MRAENFIRGPHAASSYSWMSPPRRSDLRSFVISGGEVDSDAGDIKSGDACSSERCGRWLL